MRTKDEEKFRRIIEAIQRYSAEFGNSPSIREIVAETGISRGTVQRYLAELKEQGRLDYSGHRNIRMAGQHDAMRVPLVGRIACGQPILAEENIEETYTISPALAKSGSYFLLRAEGDSMIDAGIDSGDLVLVRQQETAETGQIVVAFIDDEDTATLKRYYPEPEKKRVRLKPENQNYEDIFVERCQIQGIAVRVLKNLE